MHNKRVDRTGRRSSQNLDAYASRSPVAYAENLPLISRPVMLINFSGETMKVQDYFNLGCKLFGVYFLFLSVPLCITAISTFYPAQSLSQEFDKYLTFYKIISRLLPIIYLVIGVYLIRNSEKIFKFAYGKIDSPDLNKNSEKFRLFLKMLGIYLIADYLPDLIKSVTSYLTYSNAPKVLDFITQQRYASTNFVPSLTAIVLGVYLIRDGKFFVNLGFKKIEKNQSD